MFHLAYEHGHGPENHAQHAMSSSMLIDIDVIVPSDASRSEANSQAIRVLDADHPRRHTGRLARRVLPTPQAHAVPSTMSRR